MSLSEPVVSESLFGDFALDPFLERASTISDFDDDTLRYFLNATADSEDPFSMAAASFLSGEVHHRSALAVESTPENSVDLMSLPLAVRKLIFEHLLIAKPTTHRPRSFMFKVQRGKINKSESDVHPNILSVSKQILSETAPILYGVNKFEFDHTGAMLPFLKSIGNFNCSYISNISILRINQRNQGVGQALQDCLNLSKLQIGTPRWNLDKNSSGMKLATFIKDFLPVLQAMDNIRADGDDFFAMFGFISDFCGRLRRPIFNDGGPVDGAHACTCSWCVEYHETIRIFKAELALYGIPRPYFW